MSHNKKILSAIPFINYTNENGFYITEEAKIFLESLSNDYKIGVISIIGKYRTGKSFFLNRVLLDSESNSVFKVGNTVNSCTKVIFKYFFFLLKLI